MKSAIAASLVGLALLVVACDVKVNDQGNIDLSISQGRARDTWTRSYTIPKGGVFEIANTLGRIEAEPAGGPQLEVVAEREVRANSDEAAQAALKLITTLESVAPDSVRIEVKAERPAAGFNPEFYVSARYRVRVPPGVRVSFRNDTGEIVIRGLSSGVTASMTNGPIRGRDLSGPVDALTVNGPVELSFVAVNADVKAQTVNGGVSVDLPPDANAVIEARAVNGGVRVDDELKVQAAERERTRFRGTLNAGGPTVSLQVTNGGARVRLRGAQAGDQPAERGPELRER